MNEKELAKIGKNFKVSKESLLYGITPRLGSHLAKRFKGMRVLETCSGAGFLTIELAKQAKHVVAIDINEDSLNQAKHNTKIEGVDSKITFVHGDILKPNILNQISEIDAAILDPVWNNQVISNMSPPANLLFETVKKKTENIALILPPSIDQNSLNQFPQHETEKLYLENELALLCLYFAKLMKNKKSSFKG